MHQNFSLHLLYTTVSSHSNSQGNFLAYVMSRVQYTMYKIIAMCVEDATVLWANITDAMCEYKAGESVPCFHD